MTTKDRYGWIILDAVRAIHQRAVRDGGSFWFTVGEVSKEAGVARATARKYLDLFVESAVLDCNDLNRGRAYTARGE